MNKEVVKVLESLIEYLEVMKDKNDQLQTAALEALCSLEEEISINQDDGGSSEDGP